MLTSCQKLALDLIHSRDDNIFLTGNAGTGKSYLVQKYREKIDETKIPMLASTGVAAILQGGCTFHSFFGLGIMQDGYKKTIARALRNNSVKDRLKKIDGLLIDEISMLSGESLQAAEELCRKVRKSDKVWGGLRLIVVGDFAQLPPVHLSGDDYDWAFLSPVWHKSAFTNILLKTVVRTEDEDFIKVLNSIRIGKVDKHVKKFLNCRVLEEEVDENLPKLFSRRSVVHKVNEAEMNKLHGEYATYKTKYVGKNEKALTQIKKQAPVPERLNLKLNTFVMLRRNDPSGAYVNGSTGYISYMDDESIDIELLSGVCVSIEKTDFTLLDRDKKAIAMAINFPLHPAYALTIHKAQGLTMDGVIVDIRHLWEAGQAYVALSRVKSADELYLMGWDMSSIKVDKRVIEFYNKLNEQKN